MSGGRFLALWPWPIRLIPEPQPLPRGLQVEERIPFGTIEGEDAEGLCHHSRTYERLILKDGRHALGVYDTELETLLIHGWFD